MREATCNRFASGRSCKRITRNSIQAVGWERDGRHDAALAAYEELLANAATSGWLRAETVRRAARLHHRLGQAREALELYEQFAADNPHSRHVPEVLLATARLHDQLDQTAQAADQYRSLHAKFPQSPQAAEAGYWLALKSADENQRELASQWIDGLLANGRVADQRPTLWGSAMCLKCRLLSKRGEWQQIESIVQSCDESIEIGRLRTKLEFWAAEAAFRLRDYEHARQRFGELPAKIVGIDESWTAMVPLRRAQLAARRQQWSEVLTILEQLEQDFPEFELDYEVDYLRGRALAGRGGMTAARRFYRRVLDNPKAKQTEAAAMAGWMIGETFFHQRDYARARDAYQRVMDETSLPEWRSRAALQAGKCWELELRWAEASEVYRAALERWPNSDSGEQLQSRLRWAEKQSTESQKIQTR